MKKSTASIQRPLPTEALSYHDGYEAQNGTVVQYQSEWTKQHQLEGDGLLPLLYDHLWKSDRTREHRLREALIPDTVVFEHNFPRAWYTYDIKTAELVKRGGKLLDAQSIYQYFCAEEKGCDIVAQFYHKSVSVPASDAANSSASARRRSPLRSETAGTGGGGGGAGVVGKAANGGTAAGGGSHHYHHHHGEDREELTTAVEFFTKDSLFDFLHNRKTKPDGVLQKFLVPKGESSARHNFQIQAVWSPLVTLVYKRTNKHRLNDKTTPVHERAATFDGLAHYSSESLVADGTKSRIDALCKVIVKHFLVTEHKQITRFVLYFKVDDQDRLWVLWASSLRIGSDRLNPSYLRVPMQLAMRVENVNGGTSRDELTSARKRMHQQLVERDVDLYALTGDWAFASQCGQKFVLEEEGGNAALTHEARRHSPNTSPDGRNAAHHHHVPHPPTSHTGGGTVPALEFVPTSADEEEEARRSGAALPPASSSHHPDGYAQSGGAGIPHYRGIASISGVSARTTGSSSSPHRHVQRFYISPRAPFLPTTDRQVASDVRSPRHPLHEAYVLTHTEDEGELRNSAANPDRTAVFSGAGRKYAANPSLSSSSKATTASGGGSTPRKKQYTVRIKKTEVERVFDDLNALAQEVVYDAYCATIGGNLGATAATTAGGGGEPRSITFAADLMKCLNATEILQLAAILHVQQDATIETGDVFIIPAEAIGRGRRRDRPAAQIAEDVKQFFDRLFADPATSERIVAAWRVLHV